MYEPRSAGFWPLTYAFMSRSSMPFLKKLQVAGDVLRLSHSVVGC